MQRRNGGFCSVRGTVAQSPRSHHLTYVDSCELVMILSTHVDNMCAFIFSYRTVASSKMLVVPLQRNGYGT